jgi:hypothetical protein
MLQKGWPVGTVRTMPVVIGFPKVPGWDKPFSAYKVGTPMIITAGRTLTWVAWVKAVEQLEARAELAERNGLPRTARSWRDMIAGLARTRSVARGYTAVTPRLHRVAAQQ